MQASSFSSADDQSLLACGWHSRCIVCLLVFIVALPAEVSWFNSSLPSGVDLYSPRKQNQATSGPQAAASFDHVSSFLANDEHNRPSISPSLVPVTSTLGPKEMPQLAPVTSTLGPKEMPQLVPVTSTLGPKERTSTSRDVVATDTPVIDLSEPDLPDEITGISMNVTVPTSTWRRRAPPPYDRRRRKHPRPSSPRRRRAAPTTLSLGVNSSLSGEDNLTRISNAAPARPAAPGLSKVELGLIFVNSPYMYGRSGIIPNCSKKCRISRVSTDLATANIAVWNARFMNPRHAPPSLSKKPKGQKWVFNFDFEQAVYDGSKVMAAMTKRLSPGIDWTFTYSQRSDFFKPLSKMIPNTVTYPPVPVKNQAEGRSMLLIWFVSNCISGRMSVFKKLRNYLPRNRVKMYGTCGEKAPCHGHRKKENATCMNELFGTFKFYAAFENSRCRGYITEKLFRAYRLGMVPVVWGGLGREDYEAIVPGNSFIHVDDFSSEKGLADHMMRLDEDDAAYNRYFDWRRTLHIPEQRSWDWSRYCLLCEEAHKPLDKQKRTKTFGDLVHWWYSGACRKK